MEDEKQAIVDFVSNYSIELTPKTLLKLGDLHQYLPSATKVYLTHLPGSDFADTVAAVENVIAQGFNAVAHVAVRNIRRRESLESGLKKLWRSGGRNLLLLAGAGGNAQSPFQDTLAVLKEGLLEKYAWESIGFAGHPEGHPSVSQEKIKEALLYKQSYAEKYPRDYYLMTQFSFTAVPVVQWAEDLKKAGIRFPLKIGIPGVASTSSLIKHARACGVGASLNFLLRNGGMFRKLIGGVSEPNLLVRDLALAKGDEVLPKTTKLHIYPLGGFEATVKWLSAVQSGAFTLETEKGIQISE